MTQHVKCDYSVMPICLYSCYFRLKCYAVAHSRSWQFSSILRIFFTEITYCSTKWHKSKVEFRFLQLNR